MLELLDAIRALYMTGRIDTLEPLFEGVVFETTKGTGCIKDGMLVDTAGRMITVSPGDVLGFSKPAPAPAEAEAEAAPAETSGSSAETSGSSAETSGLASKPEPFSLD